MKDETMDNQQERLAWLAGLIDGDGSLTIAKNIQRKGYYTLRPLLNITNSHLPTLKVVEQILKENGLAFYVKWLEPGKHGRKSYIWRIHVYGLKRINRLLEALMPYMVTKRQQAEILYDWCEYRLTIPRGGNIKDRARRSYTDRDYKAEALIKELNQNPQRLYAKPTFEITRDNYGYFADSDYRVAVYEEN